MSDLEKKLRIQNVKHEKELKLIEDKYSEKIKILNRKISNYEENLKINNFAYKSFNKEDEEMAKINSLMVNFNSFGNKCIHKFSYKIFQIILNLDE